jgi:integrase
MALTQVGIRNTKPREKAYKLTDEKGLFLFVTPSGGKYWRFKYRFGGKEKKLAFGVYPEVSLAEAREKRDQARKMVANDVDPGVVKQAARNAIVQAAENSFQLVALEWYAKFSTKWVASHGDRTLRRLEKNVFPWIGNRPVCEIKAPELLTVLRRIENRGAIETAHRIHQICGQVFRYAIATGKAERDVSSDLRGALPPTRKRHHATIVEPKKIAELLKAIQSYEGYFVTKCALQLAPLFFVRPGELRKAEWSEFNFETAEWRIPAEKMKMRATHIVPLSAQAILILRELETLTGNSQYVFPSIRTLRRPMSDNTVLGALRRLGYSKDEMTGHGFRSMASTLLNEQGWNRDAIERQLAHAERNNIRAAYNYAEYLPERRKMMQHWADYLDILTNDTSVKTLNAKLI